jgi:predicted phosphodiesterase
VSADTFKVLILPDVHAPYQCVRAWRVALDYVRRGRPDAVVQVGDFSSFDSVSRYRPDPKRVLPLVDEIKGSNAALDELDAACRVGGVVRTNRWLLEGNHEVRLDAYVREQAPELRPFIDWREMLKLDQRGWRTVPYLDVLELGELSIAHDIGRAGVNAARQSLLDYGHNLVFGHTHRASIAYQGTVRGKRHVSATIGWLGDPEAITYRHRSMVRRDWQHGFAVVHFRADGSFWLQFIPIVGGVAVVDGEIYRADWDDAAVRSVLASTR